MRPRLLDLFCGAGGCSVGYARAGFDVVGVDIHRFKSYPYPMVQTDALDALAGGIDLDRFQAIHASPPCQAHMRMRHATQRVYVDPLPLVLARLVDWGTRTGRPWVVENVEGSPLPGALVLCGTEFNLRTQYQGREVALRRHRLFLSNVLLMGAGGCFCADDRARGRIVGVYGNGESSADRAHKVRTGFAVSDLDTRRRVMGIDWMNRTELSQAIPPIYTQHIGEQLVELVT